LRNTARPQAADDIIEIVEIGHYSITTGFTKRGMR